MCLAEEAEQRFQLSFSAPDIGADAREIAADTVALERDLLRDVFDMLQHARDSPCHVRSAEREQDNRHARDEEEYVHFEKFVHFIGG